MSVWKNIWLRVDAAMIKGVVKDIDKSQELVNSSDNPEVIVDSIDSGKIKLRVPKKKDKKQPDIE